ncbi:site-specific integrase [Paracraurococcus ruber]|uniref:Tyr recombinase domain-containing protein n=1 Tax=Paracraurococcus ruber TaxID=77675 RepID=A0ABS1D161_9PROT|nr:site-specific integrase [Paracraurococcus ruber]MBK1659852.1 hypothetical protein [Paracraurococcus ruber]TDG28952.1 site-specific integrase [Paracraurococcus ruber]
MTASPLPRPCGGRRRVAWRLEAWPEQDRRAWERAITPGGLLDDAGDAAGWRPASRRAALGVYGRFLAFLDARGTLDPTAGPGDRVTPALLNAYVSAVRSSCAPVTAASYVGVLGMTVQAMVPGRDWAWLWQVQARLQHLAVPSRNKRARVVPAAELVALGHDLMAEAGQPAAARQAALAYRDGLMIALLASRPLRQANFLAIEIGRHLLREGDAWLLRFEGRETKTGQPLEFAVPEAMHDALARYLGEVRPRLLQLGLGRFPEGRGRPAGQRLWLTADGTPCSAAALQKLLETRTTARFGRVVNTHLFRDCVATSIAAGDPAHVRIAARVLGHASLLSTERHYVVAETRAALSRHQDLVAAIRTASPGAGTQAGRRRYT